MSARFINRGVDTLHTGPNRVSEVVPGGRLSTLSENVRRSPSRPARVTLISSIGMSFPEHERIAEPTKGQTYTGQTILDPYF